MHFSSLFHFAPLSCRTFEPLRRSITVYLRPCSYELRHCRATSSIHSLAWPSQSCASALLHLAKSLSLILVLSRFVATTARAFLFLFPRSLLSSQRCKKHPRCLAQGTLQLCASSRERFSVITNTCRCTSIFSCLLLSVPACLHTSVSSRLQTVERLHSSRALHTRTCASTLARSLKQENSRICASGMSTARSQCIYSLCYSATLPTQCHANVSIAASGTTSAAASAAASPTARVATSVVASYVPSVAASALAS